MSDRKETTRERFDRQVRELGGEPAYDEWQGTHIGHKVICKEGHEGSPRPANIQRGRGLCRKCTGQDPEQAEDEFRARIIALGGTPVFNEWQGTHGKHKVICKKGHECNPYPSRIQQGEGICRKCAGNDPKQAEEEFKARIIALGGTPAYGEWLGVMKPHKVICKEGHECNPRPSDVQQGQGICRKCMGMHWDAFYVLGNPVSHVVKFGITTGDPRPRLSKHKYDGFIDIYYLKTEFPGAYDLECKVKIGLAEAGFEPVQGREYFRDTALPFIMSMGPGVLLS